MRGMVMKQTLMNALKKHKFKNNDIITYVALNDEYDGSTPTDVANEIYTTFTGSNKDRQREVLDLIFDGVYGVVFNKTSKKFTLLDNKTMESAELEITVKNGSINFKANQAKIKIQITFNTPDVVKKTTDPQVLKEENASLLKRYGIEIKDPTLGPKDYKAIAKVFENMANV